MEQTMLLEQELIGVKPLTIELRPIIDMTDEQFFQFCQINRKLRIERTAKGEIIIMKPAGGESGGRNAQLTAQLVIWANRIKTGAAFDSSTGFKLPNGADRSPDAAWVPYGRLATLTDKQKREFLPLCPDFVVELRSYSDRLKDVKEKMEEYLANGAQLGWLIDPSDRSVYVYRPDQPIQHLLNPTTLSGEPLLPGFELELTWIWDTGF